MKVDTTKSCAGLCTRKVNTQDWYWFEKKKQMQNAFFCPSGLRTVQGGNLHEQGAPGGASLQVRLCRQTR